MATTIYTLTTLTAEGVAQIAQKSKKATAVAAADAYAAANKVDVTVTTGAGTIVHEAKGATKKIKMSAPYTRVVPVSQDEINGKRVAYVRKRVGFALLDANWTGEGNGTYTIYDLERRVELTGETVEVRTTREAGRWFADEAPALRAQIVAAEGANA